MQLNMGAFLAKRAEVDSSKTGLVYGDKSLTFAEMNDRACRLAHAFIKLGVEEGQRIAILAQNCVEYYDTWFAAAKIGAVIVPVNWRLALPEIQFILENSGAKVLVFGEEYVEAATSLRGHVNIAHYIYTGPGSQPDFALHMDEIREKADNWEPRWAGEGDDTLVIMYTSGTTGRPKGTMLTHANFFWASTTFRTVVQQTQEEERTLVVLPLFHIAGMFAMPTFVHWGQPVYLMKGFDPKVIFETIQKEKISGFGAVPAILAFMRLVPDWQKYDTSSLKVILVFAAPVPVPLIKEYAEAGVVVRQLYGLTECCGPATVIGPDDAVVRAGSCGKAFFHTDVKIVDANGEETKAGEMGEVIIKGGHVMKGYWQNQDATAETLKDGWLHTGDVAYRDEDGFIYIADRLKDMIISGGENIYPAEIESTIFGHPKVADVGVIGVPDDKWGESVMAIVVPKPGEEVTAEEIIDYCKGRIAKYKVPKSVVFTDALPRNPSGKILKRVLRDDFGK